MKKILLSLFIVLLSSITLVAQPKTEIRAVWLTTNYALDWPQSDKNPTSQKKKLQDMLDKLQAININTIYFQAQCRSDVFWESEYQPWSRYITGTPGKKPDYDVLQFVIDECRARNMEVHAWVITYPLGSQTVVDYYGDTHVKNRYPELCLFHSNEWYLDPGLPETRKYLIDMYTELVEKYDFDGISLDYTRYPNASFPDDESFAIYGGNMNRNDWRRDNINKFAHELYDMIQTKRPGMRLSCAPVGAYESLPDAPSTFTARNNLFQDPVEWMQSEKLDLAAPQLYWVSGYVPHLKNWIQKSNGRPIVAGLAAYKMLPKPDGENWPITNITNQITQARNEGAAGICFYRTEQITTNYKKLYDDLKENQLKYPANIPPMDWFGVSKPNAPLNLTVEHKEENTYTISWTAPELNDNIPIKYYSLYTSTSETVDIDDVKNLAGHYIKGNSFEYTLTDTSEDHYFTVTAFDKGYYESDASNVVVIEKLPVGCDDLFLHGIELTINDGEVRIYSDIMINQMQIYSVNGMLISSEVYNSSEITIPAYSLSRGAYIAVISLEDGSIVQEKIIK